MVLYAADLSKLAQPVKGVRKLKVKTLEPESSVAQVTKAPTKRVKKQLEPPVKKKVAKEKVVKEMVVKEKIVKPKISRKKVVVEEEPEEEEEEEEEEEVVVPVKRKQTKKQLIAELEESLEEPVKKKRVILRKAEPVVEEEAPVEKKKRVRKPKESLALTPPKWVEAFVQAVKTQEAQLSGAKVSMKEVKQAAKDVAQESWNNGLTRDRVNNEVDNHMNRMYSQIFASR